MNPWDIASWIGAICLSIVMVALTAQVVMPKRSGTKSIIRKG